MNPIIQTILDWSELWGTAIPMIVYLVYQPDFLWVPPIVQYLLVAFLMYFFIDIIMFGNQVKMYGDNNWMYNVLAIVRVIFFTRFFELVSPKPTVRKYVLLIFALAVVIIFVFFDHLAFFSSKLVTTESIAVLFFAVRYFNNLYLLKKDSLQLTRSVILISSAILFYYATTMIIGVVYDYLVHSDPLGLAVSIWDIHNLIYIITMLLFASALKTKTKNQRVEHS